MSDLTPEQDRRLQIAYHDTRCSSFCQDDVSTYPKVPDVLRGVVAQMLADERERVLSEVQAVFELQCPPMPAEQYVDRGAWMAHRWWNTVLGSTLHRLRGGGAA